jgi:GNAT superfamily N-acetyltransferase
MAVWASPYLAAQAAYLRHLAGAPASEVFEQRGVWAVRTGVSSNTENGVLSDDGANVAGDVVRKLTEWFAEWGVPASWICAEGAERLRTAAVLESAGWEPERNAREMRAAVPALVHADPAPEGVRLERVTSVPRLDEWLDVAAACGWFETDAEREAMRVLQLDAGLAPTGPLRLYLARQEGSPVGMAAALYSGTTALLIANAVLASSRRSGIGSALARTRLREARAEGCELAVLAPSPDGAKLYESLGFETYSQPSGRWFYAPSELPS